MITPAQTPWFALGVSLISPNYLTSPYVGGYEVKGRESDPCGMLFYGGDQDLHMTCLSLFITLPAYSTYMPITHPQYPAMMYRARTSRTYILLHQLLNSPYVGAHTYTYTYVRMCIVSHCKPPGLSATRHLPKVTVMPCYCSGHCPDPRNRNPALRYNYTILPPAHWPLPTRSLHPPPPSAAPVHFRHRAR
jgi:hypothetical protein